MLVQAAALLVLAPYYGPHRDELYFVAAGDHLAWGYPDQPAFTPLLARLADLVAPANLVVLRDPERARGRRASCCCPCSSPGCSAPPARHRC